MMSSDHLSSTETLRNTPSSRRHSLSFRWVLRLDATIDIFRICRLVYEVGERNTKNWRAIQWTFALCPTLLRFRREDDAWVLRIFFLRIHRKVCLNGRPV